MVVDMVHVNVSDSKLHCGREQTHDNCYMGEPLKISFVSEDLCWQSLKFHTSRCFQFIWKVYSLYCIHGRRNWWDSISSHVNRSRHPSGKSYMFGLTMMIKVGSIVWWRQIHSACPFSAAFARFLSSYSYHGFWKNVGQEYISLVFCGSAYFRLDIRACSWVFRFCRPRVHRNILMLEKADK